MTFFDNNSFRFAFIIFTALSLFICIYYAWQNFKLLFEPSWDELWFFPKEAPPTPNPIIKDKISLTIKLPDEATVTNKTTYPIIVHGHLSIGFLFFYFLKAQYTHCRMVTDVSIEEKQGWKFYSVSRSGKRKTLLNPALTIRQNGLKENGVIEAVRLVSDSASVD